MDRTRRGLLGVLAATTGCLGFGGNDEVTPGAVTDSPPVGTNGETATPRPATAAETEPATTTPTDTPTATATPTDTPTPTPRDAQAPPVGSIRPVGKQVFASEVDGGTAFVNVVLQNTGDVAFRLLELRIDVIYETPLAPDPRRVATGLVAKRFADSFGNGRENVNGRLPLTGDVDGSEPDRRFSAEIAFRRVVY